MSSLYGNITSIAPATMASQHSVDVSSTVYGAFLICFSFIALLLTIFVIVAMLRSGQSNRNGTTIYVLAVWSLFNSAFELLILTFYVGPQIFFKSPAPDTILYGEINHHMGHILQASIFSASMFQAVIGFNRFLAYGEKKILFKRRTHNIVAVSISILAFGISYIPAYVLPCCELSISYFSYGLTYITFVTHIDPLTNLTNYNFMFNYVQYYTYIPIYAIVTILSVICYTYIFVNIYRLRNLMINNKDHRKDVIRSSQFALIFFFHASYWIYSEIISYSITKGNLYQFKTLFILLEATMNAIINAFNAETRKALSRLFVCRNNSISPHVQNILTIQQNSPLSAFSNVHIDKY